MSLSGLSDELSQVRTKKKEFLSQIERIVPWGEWIKPVSYTHLDVDKRQSLICTMNNESINVRLCP